MSSYFECSGNGPIVTTKAGKIRGYLWNTTYTFQGIKYANAKRFQMPEEIQPWDGIKDATSYGYVCPLLTHDVSFSLRNSDRFHLKSYSPHLCSDKSPILQ